MKMRFDHICENCESEFVLVIKHTFEPSMKCCPMCGAEVQAEEVEE